MPKNPNKHAKLIRLLNESLGWELRAQAMYAHYAAYVKGLESLALTGHFEAESAESVGHAKQVRDAIAMLGGEAVTVRDRAPIVHTGDTRVMLKEALKTEAAAADVYRRIVPLVKDNSIFFHALSHIMMDEMKAVVELENLLAR
jgi:bacterioferritin (cytochrome b1)